MQPEKCQVLFAYISENQQLLSLSTSIEQNGKGVKNQSFSFKELLMFTVKRYVNHLYIAEKQDIESFLSFIKLIQQYPYVSEIQDYLFKTRFENSKTKVIEFQKLSDSFSNNNINKAKGTINSSYNVLVNGYSIDDPFWLLYLMIKSSTNNALEMALIILGSAASQQLKQNLFSLALRWHPSFAKYIY